jgi:hypothetical protein
VHEHWKAVLAEIDRIVVSSPSPKHEGMPTSASEADPEIVRKLLLGIKPAARNVQWYKSRFDGAIYSKFEIEAIHQCWGDFRFVLFKGENVIAEFVIAHGWLESSKLESAPLEEESLKLIYAFANWHLPFYRVAYQKAGNRPN